MRRFLIAANWKMNSPPEGAFDANSPYHSHAACDIIVFPTYLHIKQCIESQIMTGAQYGDTHESGARTGDVNMAMLKEIGCTYVLCGHSERRDHYKETDADVAAQVVAALEALLHPIVCVGETTSQREQGKEKEVISAQLASLPLESDITIAYEPVWAIGTGNTATPEQAEEMHAHIRSILPESRREQTRILYGGSMNELNALSLLKQPNIDGGLVGGASLKPDSFAEIINSALEIEEK